MRQSVGVQPGRVCPRCGQEDSVPLVYGLPSPGTNRLVDRGLLALGGCLMPGDDVAFACRSCDLEWGDESAPTADEAELAGLLDVGHDELVRALGTGWRSESAAEGGADGARWFVSGEPAQVAVGVLGPWFVLARPLTSWDDEHPSPLAADGPRFTREDVLHLPDVVAGCAETVASSRRRSFRWCRSCRQSTPPEHFVVSDSCCRLCSEASHDSTGDF